MRWHSTAATLHSMVSDTSTHSSGSSVPESSMVLTACGGPASGKYSGNEAAGATASNSAIPTIRWSRWLK